MTFPRNKNTFFTLFILSRASDNTTSQNIGGTDAWAVPHLKFWGNRLPQPPRSPPLLVFPYCLFSLVTVYLLLSFSTSAMLLCSFWLSSIPESVDACISFQSITLVWGAAHRMIRLVERVLSACDKTF